MVRMRLVIVVGEHISFLLCIFQILRWNRIEESLQNILSTHFAATLALLNLDLIPLDRITERVCRVHGLRGSRVCGVTMARPDLKGA